MMWLCVVCGVLRDVIWCCVLCVDCDLLCDVVCFVLGAFCM